MFEAISHTTKTNDAGISSKEMTAQPKQEPVAVKKAIEQQQQNENHKPQEVPQEALQELTKDLEIIHNVNLHFSLHKDTGRTMVKVVNKETKELIREIPSEEILNLAAKLDEMVGMILDKTA